MGRTYYKITVSEKIKTINNRIKQNKAQYNSDRQTANNSDLSSGIAGKYQFLSGKDVLTEKYLLEKAATTKRFECLPLESELKKQTSNAGIQYKRLEKTYKLDKNEYKTSKKEKPAVIS